jgi:hypothetical protein
MPIFFGTMQPMNAMITILGKKVFSSRAHATIADVLRKHVLSTCLCILAWPTVALAGSDSGTSKPTAETRDARVVTMTYLKSAPGKLAQLERYVRANWFAMDKIAVERGLFVSYQWLDTDSDEGPWNAIVMVTYRDAQGFAGIEGEWAGIRAAHREVLIDGARQADLGRVVESREFFERPPFVNVVDSGLSAEGAVSETDPEDESAIRATVGRYFEAGVTGNPETIREAFLPSARIEGLRGEDVVTWSFDEYARFFDGSPAPGADRIERTIISVAKHGNSAVVQLRLRFSPEKALDEQLLLLRIDGQWKITYKSYVPSP